MPDSRTPDSSHGPAASAPADAGERPTELTSEAALPRPSGREVGRYRVRGLVGTGGFARVYRALDPELELDIALKVLKPALAAEPETVERFRREASTAAKLRHPNVVTVLTVGRLDAPFDGAPVGTPYLVMDYLPSSLGARLDAGGPVPEAELARIGEDVARGLAYAHGSGVIHRDVKPDNVLFTADGRAQVTDFGIAGAVDARASSASRQVVLGTPSYFSPEQARGLPLDGRSDLYALGVTLYQASTGVLPFEGDDWYDVMRQHVEATPVPPRERIPALSPAFEAVVLRCLAKDPVDRFQTAGELADALAALRARGSEAATVAVLSLPETPRRSRRPVALAAGGLAVAALAATAWVALSAGGERTRERLAATTVPRVDSAVAQAPDDTLAGLRPDSIALVSLPARLTVDAPLGATIALDGGLPVPAPWRVDSIPAGRHVLRGALPSLPGCATARDERTIELGAGETRNIRLRLLPCGELAPDVTPTPASFTITPARGGGARKFLLPLEAPLVLPEGWYRVQVEARTCAPFQDSVRVSTGAVRSPLRIRLICG